MLSKIRKRDGRIVEFDINKITQAVLKAANSVSLGSQSMAEKISREVLLELEKLPREKIPDVEVIQDLVENTLMKQNFHEIAKAYILYREERKRIREAKTMLGVSDDQLKLSINAIKVLERRYLKKDPAGRIIESPEGMFLRVAKNISSADTLYSLDPAKSELDFFKSMTTLEFVPNSPTLMNAGKDIQQLSACFVLPVADSMDQIFDAVKDAALIHQSGGGTGFAFSRLRPKGDIVKSTGGVASGPVSFMRVFNIATEVIKQGGTRRGANMGILRIDHPDILEFITAKENNNEFQNFNISVAATDKFMDALFKDEDYDLVNPRNKQVVNKLNARKVFDLIVTMAWKNGDPGIIFIDRINATNSNPTPALGEVESTNPCGEQPLLPFESCNLGSINLARMTKEEKGALTVDYEKLGKTVKMAVLFLDNVIDMNRYPLPQLEEMSRIGNRKIGLGVMGWADLLIELGVAYNSDAAVKLADQVMGFIDEESKKASSALAEQRGTFQNWERSIWKGRLKLRNATTTTIAPTGTISIIANCSSGIEPLFAVSFIRNVMDNTELLEVNPVFEHVARKEGFYTEWLMKQIAQHGSVQDVAEVPEKWRKVFVTAHDISPEWHVKMQAAFQRHTDNAVSKTVNLTHYATPKEVEDVYLLAYKLGCKGVTIYRDGSKDNQVLNISEVNRPKEEQKEAVTVGSEYSGGCESCTI